jgi:hypothetical protein
MNASTTWHSNQKVFNTGGRGELCCSAVITKAVNTAASIAIALKKPVRFFRVKPKGIAKPTINLKNQSNIEYRPFPEGEKIGCKRKSKNCHKGNILHYLGRIK